MDKKLQLFAGKNNTHLQLRGPNQGSNKYPSYSRSGQYAEISATSVGSGSAVELIQGLCRYAMEKLARKDAEKGPCEIERLENVAGVVRSLGDKFPFELVEEFEVELHWNKLEISFTAIDTTCSDHRFKRKLQKDNSYFGPQACR